VCVCVCVCVCVGSQYDCSLGTFHLTAFVIVNEVHTQGLAGRYTAVLCTIPLYLTPGSGFPTAVYIGGLLTHAKSARSVLYNRSARYSSSCRGNVCSQICTDWQFYDAHFSKNLSDSFLQ